MIPDSWGPVDRSKGFQKIRKQPGHIVKISGKREPMAYGHHAYYEVHGDGTDPWEIMPYGPRKSGDMPRVTTISTADVRKYLDMYYGRTPTVVPLHGNERGAAANRKLNALDFLQKEADAGGKGFKLTRKQWEAQKVSGAGRYGISQSELDDAWRERKEQERRERQHGRRSPRKKRSRNPISRPRTIPAEFSELF